jgi:hypothetical protein
LFQPVDTYCERLGPGLWQEPLNVLASVVLVAGALWLHQRLAAGRQYRQLALLAAIVGATSSALHLWAIVALQVMALCAIALFAVVTLYRATADLLGMPRGLALLATAIFLPFTLGAVSVMALATGPSGSLALAPFPLLILGYAGLLRSSNPVAARDLLLVAILLAAALGMRALDGPMCDAWPHGTHFLYILAAAAAMLRLVWALARHALAGGDEGR